MKNGPLALNAWGPISCPLEAASIVLSGEGVEETVVSRELFSLPVNVLPKATLQFQPSEARVGEQPVPNCNAPRTASASWTGKEWVAVESAPQLAGNSIAMPVKSGLAGAAVLCSDMRLQIATDLRITPGRAHIEQQSFRSPTNVLLEVYDETGAPVAGADVRIEVADRDGQTQALASLLLREWKSTSGRAGTFAKPLKIPAVSGFLALTAKGFRPSRLPLSGLKGEGPRRVALRRLPTAVIEIVPALDDPRECSLVVKREPTGSDLQAWRPGAPLPQSKLVMSRNGAEISTASFPVEEPGTYEARLACKGEKSAGSASLSIEAEAEGRQTLLIDRSERLIEVVVRRGEEPARDVFVKAAASSRSSWPDSTSLAEGMTDEAGRVSLAVRYRGQARVMAPDAGGARSWKADLSEDRLSRVLIDLPSKSVRAKVLDKATQTPIEGASVDLDHVLKVPDMRGGLETKSTASNGEAAFALEGPSIVTWRARKKGYTPVVLERVAAGEAPDAIVTLELEPAKPLRILVETTTGAAVPGASVFTVADPAAVNSRLVRMAMIGVADGSGVVSFETFPGYDQTAFVVAAGYALQIVSLPARPSIFREGDGVTIHAVLEPIASSAPVRLVQTDGARRPVMLGLARGNVDVPFPILSEVCRVNQIDSRTMLVPDRNNGYARFLDLLPRGQYSAFVLYIGAKSDPRVPDARVFIGAIDVPNPTPREVFVPPLPQ